MSLTSAPPPSSSSEVELAISLDPRILIVDDNPAIHDDVRKILNASDSGSAVGAMEQELFGDAAPQGSGTHFDIDSALQGMEGLRLVEEAKLAGRPYAVALIDMRMPPGWDGVETIARLWQVDPHIQMVICTAYSDLSWSEMVQKLTPGDGLLILRKPFDAIEIRQMVHALSGKWFMGRELGGRLADLEGMVADRTAELVQTNAQLRSQILGRAHMEAELHFAEKLERVGQLAAEAAHSQAAPIESMMEAVSTLRLATHDIATVLESYRRMLLQVSTLPGQEHLVEELRRTDEAVSLPALSQNIPWLLQQLSAGLAPAAALLRTLRSIAGTTAERPPEAAASGAAAFRR